jgi:hypothetical protein
MMQGRQMRRAVACVLQHLSYSRLQFLFIAAVHGLDFRRRRCLYAKSLRDL